MNAVACWCGNADLVEFSADYLRCPACESLVARELPGEEIGRVEDDGHDFYGRSYWYVRQEAVHGFPNIEERAWLDVPERCAYWLRTLLKYKRPPGRVLELGCAHGGFVALLQWAGYEAAGLELSPTIADFARDTFGVRVYTGPVERQDIEPGSLDVIVLMDVLEHFRDPVATMRHCLRLLREDGVLLIQTPNYPAGITHQAMLDSESIFLKQLKPGEHLFLFSDCAARELCSRLGASHVFFEPAIYAYYDQFFVAAKREPEISSLPVRRCLTSPSGRMVQALLDAAGEREDLRQRWQEAQASEVAALERLHELRQHVNLLEEDRNHAWAEVRSSRESAEKGVAALERLHELRQHVNLLEEDRNHAWAEVRSLRESAGKEVAALERLHELRQHVNLLEEDRNHAWAEVRSLRESAGQQEVCLAQVTAERECLSREAAGLEMQSRELQAQLSALEVRHAAALSERDACLAAIERQNTQIADLQMQLEKLGRTRLDQDQAIQDHLAKLGDIQIELLGIKKQHNDLACSVEAFRQSFTGRALRKAGLVLP